MRIGGVPDNGFHHEIGVLQNHPCGEISLGWVTLVSKVGVEFCPGGKSDARDRKEFFNAIVLWKRLQGLR